MSRFQNTIRMMFRSVYLRGASDALTKNINLEPDGWEDMIMEDFIKLMEKSIPRKLNVQKAKGTDFWNQEYGFNACRQFMRKQFGLKDDGRI